MTENLAIYTNRGYREDERRSQGAFDLVYMSKALPSPRPIDQREGAAQ